VDALVLRSEALELEVLPDLGARWHRLRAFGVDLLRTPADLSIHAREPFFWGAYVMAPWCNRAPAEPMAWHARRISLSPDFPDGSAIHGQVYARPWRVEEPGRLRVEAEGDGWPWRYSVTQRLFLEDGTLRVELTLRNLDDAPMPGGLGLHPWFVRPVEVVVAAAAVYDRNVGSPPEPMPVSGALDLRRLAQPAAALDATWAALDDPAVRLRWPATGISVTWRLGGAASHVVVATPADLHATAVEPQTHAPDPLRRLLSGEPGRPGVLQPGQELLLTAEMSFTESNAS
jgi:aldose 1-epimerase